MYGIDKYGITAEATSPFIYDSTAQFGGCGFRPILVPCLIRLDDDNNGHHNSQYGYNSRFLQTPGCTVSERYMKKK